MYKNICLYNFKQFYFIKAEKNFKLELIYEFLTIDS